MNKKALKKEIERLYIKWSESGLNAYEKIALKHLEDQYKKSEEVK